MAENENPPAEKKQQKNKESPDIQRSEKKATSEEKIKETKEPDQGARPDQQKKKEKKGNQPARNHEPVKKKEHDENFNYIIRVVNTDINGENNIVQGLTQIKGIG